MKNEKKPLINQRASVIVRRIWDIRAALEQEGIEFIRRPSYGSEIHPHLIRFKGFWYVGTNDFSYRGTRIIRSQDGINWKTLPDPHPRGKRFSITAGGELMMNTLRGDPRPDQGMHGDQKCSCTWLSKDGLQWEGPFEDKGMNTLRWDVTWHNGRGYSLAYTGRDFAGTLYATEDGKTWQELARDVFPEEHRAGYEEASLAFDPTDGTMHALVRANKVYAIIGRAEAPYTRWQWRDARAVVNEGQVYETGREEGGKLTSAGQPLSPRPAQELFGPQMGGPILTRLSDGRFLAAGRSDATSAYEVRPWSLSRIDLFVMDPQTAILTRLARLDGFGHYPGVVEHDGKVWVSCGRWVGERPEVCLVTVDL